MKIFSMTDVGRKREMNQDYVFATDESLGTLPNLLVVADGMGGHKAGDFASKYTVEVLKEYEKKGFFGEVVFTCGCLVKDNKVIIYYGAADDKICRADFELDDLFATMEYVDI